MISTLYFIAEEQCVQTDLGRSLPYVCVAEILLSYVYFDDKLHKSRLKILSWFPSMNQNQTWTESKVVSV